MTKQLFLLFFLIQLIFFGCSDSSKKDPKLLEAFEIHKESVHTVAKALEILEKLPENDSMRSKFDDRLNVWGEDLVEVPGFHYHHEGLGHHHNRPPLKLTTDEVLLVQKEFRDSINAIFNRIQTYKARLSK